MKLESNRRLSSAKLGPGFTLLELLVVILVIGILVSILLPVLSKCKQVGKGAFCMNNAKQLTLGWILYADDNADRLPLNLGASEIKQALARGKRVNWADSVLNWELDPDNTNVVLNSEAALGPYVGKVARVFRCPSDYALSSLQKRAGWESRSRSLSMNAMVGDAGEFTRTGENVNNREYRQFRKMSEFAQAKQIFVFIEEHPDSINDGYFLNRGRSHEWNDLPASWHNGSANLSYSDGHVRSRRWINKSTKKRPVPDAAGLPFKLRSDEESDFKWLLYQTSVYVDHN